MATTPARRRQRSTRLVVAVVILAVAAVLVAASLATGAAGVRAAAAIAAVVLGAAATRITHSELLQNRRDAAADRARQAQAFRVIDARRTDDHLRFVAHLAGEAESREDVVHELETALVAAQRRTAEITRKFSAEARRAQLAEDENELLERRVTESDERAAEAIVHLIEVEQEVDVLRAELTAWKALETEQTRQHA